MCTLELLIKSENLDGSVRNDVFVISLSQFPPEVVQRQFWQAAHARIFHHLTFVQIYTFHFIEVLEESLLVPVGLHVCWPTAGLNLQREKEADVCLEQPCFRIRPVQHLKTDVKFVALPWGGKGKKSTGRVTYCYRLRTLQLHLISFQDGVVQVESHCDLNRTPYTSQSALVVGVLVCRGLFVICARFAARRNQFIRTTRQTRKP